ncbi:MAG: TonB-dependent receptor [Flavobacteriaceae bacterium]|nr:TonB-dependent receptor [Flavobacteriaceae bacterium]
MAGLRNAIFIVLLCFTILGNAQKKYTLSGTVLDDASSETLIGVSIVFPELNTGATTNTYGFYSITLPEGSYRFSVSYLGYETLIDTLTLDQNITKNFRLLEKSEALEEVILNNDNEQIRLNKPQMSINVLTSKTIDQIPALLGETDLIKSLTLLPGVTNAGEGSSGFNVRGGAVDQNLLLIDEAVVYNSSHLFGLFSVFNTDAIKDVKLYKGGIPARYGGRVSSVLDIYQKEGNNRQFHMNGGIGLVSSKLLAEGPIKKEVSSFIIGGRTTYAHLFLPLFDNKNVAYFYDLNAKFSFSINAKNKVYFSGYFGRDVFNIADNFENIYGNSAFNFRWNHLFSDKLFSNLSLIYSDYYYGLNLDFVGFKWNSGIKNLNLKYDFKDYLTDTFTLYFGFNTIYYHFNPGEIRPASATSGITVSQLINKYAIENAAYLEAEQQLSDKLSLSYGLRLSNFLRLGQKSLNEYAGNKPVVFNEELQIYEKADPETTMTYKRSDVIKVFNNPEPRFSLAYQYRENASFKLSYNRMSQYLHLLSNTSSPTPLDVWTPSGKYIKPQLLDQFAIGYYRSIQNNTYTLELETFYKKVKNRIDYIDGADLIANDAIEQVILNGRARAYGLELLLKKNAGKFNGWLSYTFSNSEQQTPPRTPTETGINNGNWYKTPYDKTHDLSLTGNYKFNERWTLSTNFIFQTGLPVTLPGSQYNYNGLTVIQFKARNSNRLPNYNRLDLSLRFVPESRREKNWKGEWVFGIYNIYNRKNAASLSFRNNADTGYNEVLRLSLFGIIPSVSYNFKF